MLRSSFPVRLPALSLTPVLAVGLVALPVVEPTAADPEPVAPELQTVPLEGIESDAISTLALPDDEPVTDDVLATTEPVTTDPFSVVAVTWDDPSVDAHDLQTWVRHRSEGSWSQWYTMPHADGHGPDEGTVEAAGQRGGTDPLIVPESDGVQVRVDAGEVTDVNDLRVDLIDPGESEADHEVQSTSAAAAAASRPAIRTRADWGADERLRNGRVSYGQIKAGFVHHTVNSNSYSKADVPSIIRGIYAYHVKSRGWQDIGYNFLVDRFGRIWEGRAGGIDKPVTGAHTYGHNDDAFGVSVIGTYTSAKPPAAVLDAFAQMYAYKFSLHGVDPQSKVNLDGTTTNAISGHRDTYATACPGDALYAKLAQIRATTAALMSKAVPTSDRIRVSLSPATSDLGAKVTVKVASEAVLAGRGVQLEKQKVSNGTWKVVRTGTLNSKGNARFTISPANAGTFKLRAGMTSPAMVSAAATLVVQSQPAAPVEDGAGSDIFERTGNGVFRIVGHGYGHGRGMSQWGAREGAARGKSEAQITARYYPGTNRSTKAGNPRIRVLLAADTGHDLIVRPEPGLRVSFVNQKGLAKNKTLPVSPKGCRADWWSVVATGNDLAIKSLCDGDWRAWRTRKKVNGNQPVRFSTPDAYIDVARRHSSGFERKGYRGAIEGRRSGASVMVINDVRMQQYLKTVVPAEMPSSWPREALRAQAVAARTYALREAADRGGAFDVYDSTRSQVYTGAFLYDSGWNVVRRYETEPTNQAVRATRLVHLRHEGRPAFTQFSSSNGGVSAAGSQPYLVKRKDGWDGSATSNSRLNWTDSVTAQDIERQYPKIGRLERIRITSREGIGDWGGRVLRLKLVGSGGTATVAGDSAIRAVLGTYSSYLTLR